MLTRDQANYTLNGKYVIPSFLHSDAYLPIAQQLIEVAAASEGMTRSELEEEVSAVLLELPDQKIAKGLQKTLEDRLVFTSSDDVDYQAERSRLFAASANLFRNGVFDTEQDFRQAVDLAGDFPLGKGGRSVYADLPDNERVCSFKQTGPQELLDRYNVGLVQAILLDAMAIDLELEHASPAKLRRLLSVAKFTRLVLDAKSRQTNGMPHEKEDKEEEFTIEMHIDGPGSILNQARAYGFQLAMFFPVICGLDTWSMLAQLQLSQNGRKSSRVLKLNEGYGLKFYGAYSAYVPQEIEAFRKLFASQAGNWELTEDMPMLKEKRNALLFPDFAFKNTDGSKVVYMELFHKWHARQLLERLDFLKETRDAPMFLGIERSLLENSALKEALDAEPAFKDRTFLYRDFPLVNAVNKMLANWDK